ncbi:MAG TPA: hypothetical protein VMB70_13550 [Terriglobia bacterium]|nr:hypothetical protein [Terriglobia bacterium]
MNGVHVFKVSGDSLDPTSHGIISRMESADTDLLKALQRGDDSAIEELSLRPT